MLMTPGPTEIPEKVRSSMGRKIQNPDIEQDFFDFYDRLVSKLCRVYDTTDDILILGGEGILGLEASVASCVGPGDEVLCIANGIYGEGFADFVEMYGAEPVMCSFSHKEPIKAEAVREKINKHDFQAATMVHCETPAGVLNELNEILELLSKEGVLTIVDAVSSLGGVPLFQGNIDICICGSQKCFSSPRGLTMVSVSSNGDCF